MTETTQRLRTAFAHRYKIERRLGEGGMATVYLAEDLKHKRKVAVKVLRPELAAVLGAERFVQEITTTANLQHPHILPLFDSGQDEIYVRPFRRSGPRRTISRGGGVFPHWLESSRQLVYHFDNNVYLAKLVFEPEFEVADRSVIFDLQGYYRYREDYGDVTKDGSTFLLRKLPGRESRPVMIFNWVKEVEERLGN